MKVVVLVRKKSRNVDGVVQAAKIANRLQSEFEFDVEQVDWLQKGNDDVRPKDVAQKVTEKRAAKNLIVIISPVLEGDYLDYARRGLKIVSTAGWDSRFAPPPLAIYLLFQFADAVASFVADLSPRQVHRRMRHNGFRACIFNSTQGRRRFLSVLIAGYICADCRARLREWGVAAAQLDSIGRLLSYVRDFTIDKPPYLPNAVFVGHGRRADWEKIRNHLSKKHRLKVEEFNVSPTAGFTTVERLTEMLESASFAILVMTAEDRQKDGKLKARQNVVHEIGLFQGRLGFPRAIVVKEDGVEEFSNIKGLTYIPFKKGKIDDALTEIDRVLIRERVISAA